MARKACVGAIKHGVTRPSDETINQHFVHTIYDYKQNLSGGLFTYKGEIMTREEAIRHGKEQLEIFGEGCEHYEFIKMAIKALSQEPTDDKCHYCEHNFTPYKGNTGEFTEQEPCDDAINRRFEKIVVEYPTICTYPEYQGKPYFSIQYEENGEHIVGYGTYKPEVLTRYIKEYFIPSVTQKYTVFHCPKCGYQDTREL